MKQVRSKEEWQGWQEYWPGRNDFNKPLIFSLMQFHYETDKLVELQYDWGGEIEIRKSGNLLGTLIRKNGLESTSKANIIYAKFSVRFEGSNAPRKVGIRSGNQATFGRDEDSLIIEDWINDQQLVIPKNPT